MAQKVVNVAGALSSLVTLSQAIRDTYGIVQWALGLGTRYDDLADMWLAWNTIWEACLKCLQKASDQDKMSAEESSNIYQAIDDCKTRTNQLIRIIEETRSSNGDRSIDRIRRVFQRMTTERRVEDFSATINMKTRFIVGFCHMKLNCDTFEMDRKLDAIAEQLRLATIKESRSIIYTSNGRDMFNSRGDMFNNSPSGENARIINTINGYVENQTVQNNVVSERTQEDLEEILQKTLRYKEMNSRLNQISDHESKTCEWAFSLHVNSRLPRYHYQVTPESRYNPNIDEWLQSEDELYVVLGKPGSGKSTFMKFIYKDLRTRVLLRKWRTTTETHILFHSFWGMSQSSIAYNWKGFLAHSIYQLITLEQLDKETISKLAQGKDNYRDWSESELNDTLKSILRCTRKGYCFFIDGIDEMKAADEIEHILSWVRETASENFGRCKFCLATRDSLDLKVLGRFQYVEIHRHTTADIKSYVSEKMSNLEGSMQKFQDDPLAEYKLQEIELTICENAKGVWIWVYYVLLLIKHTIPMSWSLSKIQDTVKAFPTDVKDLYQRALESSKKEWPQNAKERTQILCCSSHFPMSLYQLFMAIDDEKRAEYLNTHSTQKESKLASNCQAFQMILYQSTGCLIECYEDSEAEQPTSEGAEFKSISPEFPSLHKLWGLVDMGDDPGENYKKLQAYWRTAPWRNKKVRFIHRTVHEFLIDKGEIMLSLDSQARRALAEGMLVCYMEDVHALVPASLERLCNSLDGMEENDLEIVSTIDKACQRMVEQRCNTSASATRCVEHITLTHGSWFHRIVQSRTNEFLDFPGFLFSIHSTTAAKFMLRCFSATWSSYYKGYLALCAIRAFEMNSHLDRDELFELLQKLKNSGADLHAQYSSPGHDRIGPSSPPQVFRTDSCISRLLTITVSELIYTLWNSQVSLENGQEVLKTIQRVLYFVAQTRLEHITTTFFVFWDHDANSVTVDTWWGPAEFCSSDVSDDDETQNENHHKQTYECDQAGDYFDENYHDSDDDSRIFGGGGGPEKPLLRWDENAVMIQLDACGVIEVLLKALQHYHLIPFRSEESRREIMHCFARLSPELYLSVACEDNEQSFWWPYPAEHCERFAEAVFSGEGDEYVDQAYQLVEEYGGMFEMMWNTRLRSHPDIAIAVPLNTSQAPLDPRRDMVGQNWQEVSSLRGYYASLLQQGNCEFPSHVDSPDVLSVLERAEDLTIVRKTHFERRSAGMQRKQGKPPRRLRHNFRVHRWKPY